MSSVGGGESTQPPLPHHRPSPSAAHPREFHIPHQDVLGGSREHESLYRSSRNTSARLFHEPHSPPVRDAASIKDVKYGNGHEKYPSWPTSAVAEAPTATRTPPTGGSHRSKSWTDHTQYPKENLVLYTRPYMKRNKQQQLKPVFEASDRAMPGGQTKGRREEESDLYSEDKRYEESKSYAEKDYGLPSPPEREVSLNHEEYSTAYEVKKMVVHQEMKSQYVKYQGIKEPKKLTQAELEEYTKNYEEALHVQHQKQSSYAQSEGYHSYVSSTDSTSTPFLDRLRREADSSVSRSDSGLSSGAGGAGWDGGRGDRDSVVTSSSGSGSSSETLKWHGSLSDISVASSSLSLTSRQLIAHSAKVKTPQRHGSESVLYIARPVDSEIEHRAVPPGNCQKHLKLFPISTYPVPDHVELKTTLSPRVTTSYSPPQMTVAERVNELERQNKYAAYQDSKRQTRVGDPNLKAKQKSALLSFYERQQQKENKQSWRSEPQLALNQPQPPPPPKLRPSQPTSRRASSASDYADWKDQDSSKSKPDSKPEPSSPEVSKQFPLNVPNTVRFSPNSALDGPVIVGPVISLDDWVPERPPKNAMLLRNIFPDLYQQDERLPSPDLPLPSPPTVIEDEVCNDEPFPPPPVEITEWKYEQEIPPRLVSEQINKPPNTVTENVARPLPIRPVKTTTIDTSISSSVSLEHVRHTSRPIDLNLIADKTSALAHSNKRPYSYMKEKTHRNSFRSANENAPPQNTLSPSTRASMRNYRSNFITPSKSAVTHKPAIPAQKLFLRSTTVDESSPKKPINVFMRSISLRQNEPGRKSMPLAAPMQNYTPERIHNTRHSCGTHKCNGNPSPTDIPKEAVGHFRPECDQNKSVISKIEQIQQKLKGAEMIKDTCDNMNSSGVASVGPSQHGATNMKMQLIGPPPPLYPKQIAAAIHLSPEAASVNRGNDNVCYAPSRAKLPDPSVGSYKLIQPKDEQPSCPKPAIMPDILIQTDGKPAYPSFEYITRKTCEKLMNIPVEYSKKCSIEMNPTPPPNGTAGENAKNESYKESNAKQKQIQEEKPITVNKYELEKEKVKQDNSDHVKKEEVVNTKDEENNAQDESAIIEDEESSEEEVETVMELPDVTRWWETVPALEDFVRAREKLMRELPEDHEFRKLSSLTRDQRNPIDFIRDFFGVSLTISTDIQRTEGGEATAAVTTKQEGAPGLKPQLPQLMADIISCSERVIADLEAAAAKIVSATLTNEQVGNAVLQLLPAPLSTRFASHHTEVYHISSLMAALSARLARTYDEDPVMDRDQMAELCLKQTKLKDQLEEARSLKENIDSRASVLAAKISDVLEPSAYRDYRFFMAVKPRLVIRARHLQYRIEFEKERLKSLKQSLKQR